MTIIPPFPVICVLLLAAGPVAQDGAFYDGADLRPLNLPHHPHHPWVAPPLPELQLDATAFTATPDVAVRDVDGDGILDLTDTLEGVTVWHGLGGGRFSDPTFVPTSVVTTGKPVGRWGDMDGDGRLDAVYLGLDQIEVLFDQGDGTFASGSVQILVPANSYSTSSWTLGDVDGDDVPDIVARSSHGFPGTRLEILPGQLGGMFGPPEIVEVTPGFVENVALADLDGDGLTDIVVDWSLSTPVHLRTYRRLHGGGWAVGSDFEIAMAFASYRVEVRDMTGDGVPDAITEVRPAGLDFPATIVTIYEGVGDGTLSSTPHEIPWAGRDTRFVDVDGDGLVDVLSTAQEGIPGPVTLLTQPAGSLAPPVLTRHRARPVGTADFDGDGHLDLFSTEVVLYGRGDGGFASSRSFALGTTPNEQRNVAIADFDQDGVPDVAALDGTNARLTVSSSDVGASWSALELDPQKVCDVVAVGDIDHDGQQDVIIQQVNDSVQEYWLGRGDGTFGSPETFGQSFLGLVNTGLGIGQINGTAWPDFVTTGNGMLRRKLGQGELVWGQLKETPLPAGGVDPWLVLADLDLDGLDDVLVIQPEVYVYRCIGHGDFAPPVLVDGAATHVRLVDADGDGFDDLLLSDGTEVRLRLADGAAGFEALPSAVVTSELAVAGTDLADVDGDGMLDLALGHLNSWSLHLGLPGGGFAAEPVDHFDVSGEAHVLRFLDRNDDDRPDLLVVADDRDGFGLQLHTHRGGPWTDEGFALAGDGGHPFLWGTGSLVAGSTLGLELRDAAPGAPVHIVVGIAEAGLPFKGGVLVPAPLIVVSGFVTSPKGTSVLASPWPAGTPPGTDIWLQHWIEDASGPAGLTAGNGVRVTTP